MTLRCEKCGAIIKKYPCPICGWDKDKQIYREMHPRIMVG